MNEHRIIVKENIYQKLCRDKKQFEKKIGGRKWTFNDVIKEYYKIINLYRRKK